MTNLAVVLGQAIGPFELGTSLYESTSCLKQSRAQFPRFDVIYHHEAPCLREIMVALPENGIRLRFDGPSQRMHLIEVVDFGRVKLSYKNSEINKHEGRDSFSGPTFHHLYQVLGPPGHCEYLPPAAGQREPSATLVASWPGLAFAFAVRHTPELAEQDPANVLSSGNVGNAWSMALFSGLSWAAARDTMASNMLYHPELFTDARLPSISPTELDTVLVKGAGALEILRYGSSSAFLQLGESTQQDCLVAFGPPEAVHREKDRRNQIYAELKHGSRRASGASGHGRSSSTDTQGSGQSIDVETDYSDDESGATDLATAECYWNYFSHGLDVFFSKPSKSSPLPVSNGQEDTRNDEDALVDLRLGEDNEVHRPPKCRSSNVHALVATKVVIHGNVPYSYNFGRHRRLRWQIGHCDAAVPGGEFPLSSEDDWAAIAHRLREVWQRREEGWHLNRPWDDAPGNSCELIGLGEASDVVVTRGRKNPGKAANASGPEGAITGTSDLVGFPGLIFEVLDKRAVDCLTVY